MTTRPLDRGFPNTLSRLSVTPANTAIVGGRGRTNRLWFAYRHCWPSGYCWKVGVGTMISGWIENGQFSVIVSSLQPGPIFVINTGDAFSVVL